MVVLPSASNVIVLYICLEGVALMAYLMAASGLSGASKSAGMKYFLQSSLAASFLLLGMAVRFVVTHQFGFAEMIDHLHEHGRSAAYMAGLVLIFIALLFKIGSFPASF
jgi:NADH:ubiquinone oxidoreductase subunit 2 (subunit N)